MKPFAILLFLVLALTIITSSFVSGKAECIMGHCSLDDYIAVPVGPDRENNAPCKGLARELEEQKQKDNADLNVKIVKDFHDDLQKAKTLLKDKSVVIPSDDLMYALIRLESAGDPKAIGPDKDAPDWGLMQISPGNHPLCISACGFKKERTQSEYFNPALNICCAFKVFQTAFTEFKDGLYKTEKYKDYADGHDNKCYIKHATSYGSYRDCDAAIRGYNGPGCANEWETTNKKGEPITVTVNLCYVERVRMYQQIFHDILNNRPEYCSPSVVGPVNKVINACQVARETGELQKLELPEDINLFMAFHSFHDPTNINPDVSISLPAYPNYNELQDKVRVQSDQNDFALIYLEDERELKVLLGKEYDEALLTKYYNPDDLENDICSGMDTIAKMLIGEQKPNDDISLGVSIKDCLEAKNRADEVKEEEGTEAAIPFYLNAFDACLTLPEGLVSLLLAAEGYYAIGHKEDAAETYKRAYEVYPQTQEYEKAKVLVTYLEILVEIGDLPNFFMYSEFFHTTFGDRFPDLNQRYTQLTSTMYGIEASQSTCKNIVVNGDSKVKFDISLIPVGFDDMGEFQPIAQKIIFESLLAYPSISEYTSRMNFYYVSKIIEEDVGDFTAPDLVSYWTSKYWDLDSCQADARIAVYKSEVFAPVGYEHGSLAILSYPVITDTPEPHVESQTAILWGLFLTRHQESSDAAYFRQFFNGYKK